MEIFIPSDATSETSSSTISTSAIQAIVDKLKCQSHRESTRNNYYGIWKSFNEYNLKLDIKPSSWEDRLTLFMGCLICMNRKSTTIKSYISAIKVVLKYEKIYLNEDKVLLASLITACRLQNDVVKPHLLICKGLLNIIIETMDHTYECNAQPYLTTLFKALFVTAYYGLFRIGEITASQHVVCACDVHVRINKNKLMFVLHSSKTHDANVKPQIIKIDNIKYTGDCSSNHNQSWKDSAQFCPFYLLQKYTSVWMKYKSEDE